MVVRQLCDFVELGLLLCQTNVFVINREQWPAEEMGVPAKEEYHMRADSGPVELLQAQQEPQRFRGHTRYSPVDPSRPPEAIQQDANPFAKSRQDALLYSVDVRCYV